jgi:hypothetical protein
MTNVIDLQKIKSEKFKLEMFELAHENQKAMDGTTGPVKQIIDGAEVVFAMWPDPTAEHNCDFLIIKGAKLLRHCVESDQAFEARCGAVLVANIEMATAACQVLGDNSSEKPIGLH